VYLHNVQRKARKKERKGKEEEKGNDYLTLGGVKLWNERFVTETALQAFLPSFAVQTGLC
jgi:hypothetical protein